MREYFPGSTKTPRVMRTAGSLEEASRRIERLNMIDNFFRESSLLAGREAFAVGFILSRVDKRPEPLVSGVLCNVNASSAKHVVIMYHNQRPAEIRMVRRVYKWLRRSSTHWKDVLRVAGLSAER